MNNLVLTDCNHIKFLDSEQTHNCQHG